MYVYVYTMRSNLRHIMHVVAPVCPSITLFLRPKLPSQFLYVRLGGF